MQQLEPHVASAVEDLVEIVSELRQLQKSNTNARRRGEIEAQVAIRAGKAGITTDYLMELAHLRCALDERHAAIAGKVAA